MHRPIVLCLLLLALLACQTDLAEPQGTYDFIHGDLAYVPFEKEIQIIDLSDAERPLRVGRLSIGWPIVDVQVRANTLFVLRRAESAMTGQTVTDGGLMIFDLAAPTAPQELSFTAYPPFPRAMGLLDEHVYISDYEKTVIFDIGNPRSPRQLSVELDPLSSFYRDESRWLAGFGSCNLRSGSCFGRFNAIDISDPARPQVTSELTGTIPAYAVTVLGETVYTLGRGLSAMPRDQLQPLENNHTPGYIATYSGQMIATDSHLYVAEGNQLFIFDVADPLFPEIIGVEESPPQGTYYVDFAIRDQTAFTVSQYGLHVIDVSTPSAPRGVAIFDLTH